MNNLITPPRKAIQINANKRVKQNWMNKELSRNHLECEKIQNPSPAASSLRLRVFINKTAHCEY